MKTRRILALAIFAAAAASAQTPTPAEVEGAKQIVQSGVPITPQMIQAAKAKYPALRTMSDEEIQATIADERNQSRHSDKSGAEGMGDGTDANAPSSPPKSGASGERSAPGDGELKRFGQDFFRNGNLSGLSASTAPLPEYILSSGDEIRVSTWGRESRNEVVTIDNDGMFQYPPLAPMRLAGMRFASAQQRIISEIEKIHGVTASISLGKLRSIRVMVLGETENPGSYVLPAGVTVTSGLFRSGGVSPIGSLRAIEVRRDGKTVATLDLYDMLLRGKSKDDIQLLPGDIIFVPLAKVQVSVGGLVNRPAIYEVKGQMRALDMVELAGGLQAGAFKGRMQLNRIQGNKRRIALDVDMEKPDSKSNVKLENGDVLFVDRVLDNVEDAVWIRGNVNRPGRYQYKRGMTVRDLLPSLNDLEPETFFEYAHIRRPSPDDGRSTLQSFPLGDVFSKGARVPLEPRDTVIIYNRYDLVERPLVIVSGMVRGPGAYPYSESMRVSDLIVLGGGLGQAHLEEAHLFRQLTGPNDSLYRQLIRVNLRKVLENPGSEDNVELRPFDELTVFARTNFILPRGISVYGAVNHEGSFPLAEGMTIPDAIKLAGGLNRRSFKLGIEVVRRTIVKDSLLNREVLKMNLQDLLDGKKSFQLEDGDAVYVREVIKSRAVSNVILAGEFNFPGRYEATAGERLSQVIRRAGGFTPEAYLRGAVFLRKRVREQQLLHAEEAGRRLEGQMQARLQQATQEQERAAILAAMGRSTQLVDAIKRAPYLGRVVVSIDPKLKFAGSEWDMELEDGDSLWVGPRVSTVSVLGEVSSPTTVIYTRKTNQVGELLAKAGGVNTYGDYKETFYLGPDGFVTTPRTTPWYSSFKCKKVEAGGTIIVPMKPPAKDYLEVWLQSSQILYHLAVSVGVAAALF
jgi:polysaccharide export outer membrane protein